MRAITVFLVLAFGISWGIAWAIHAAGGFSALGQVYSVASLMGYMMGPSIAAVVTALIFDKGRFWASLGLRGFGWGAIIFWTVLAWIIAIALSAASVALTLHVFGQAAGDPAATIAAQLAATGQESPMSPEELARLQIMIGVPVGIAFNTVFLLLSEELGWRGWLQPRLAGLGFWPMSILIGLIWGAWHGPIILMGHNYGDMGWTGVGLMLSFTVLLTPFHSLVRERGGVIPAAGLHGAVNAVAGVGLLFIANPVWPWNGLLGYGGVAVMLAGWVLIALVRRKPSTAS